MADSFGAVHHERMPGTRTSTKSPSSAPVLPRPEREDLLKLMLEKTARGGVPIRRAFLQTTKSHAGTRGSALAELVRTRDESALDAYLLIHAMASSSDPYRTWFPASTWARVTDLDAYAGEEAAKARWSKVVSKLVKLNLVKRERSGNKMNYWLLHENGTGEDYKRPTALAHGSWFSIPHLYWTEGHDQLLTLPEKAMLLIALDQPDASRLPYDQMPAWYGVSASTAERGLTGLLTRGNYIDMSSEWKVEPKSPTGWTEIRRYTTIGDWSIASRKAAITKSERRRRPTFEGAEGDST